MKCYPKHQSEKDSLFVIGLTASRLYCQSIKSKRGSIESAFVRLKLHFLPNFKNIHLELNMFQIFFKACYNFQLFSHPFFFFLGLSAFLHHRKFIKKSQPSNQNNSLHYQQ